MQNITIVHTKTFLWAALALAWPIAAGAQSDPAPLAPGQGPVDPVAPNPTAAPTAQGYTGASAAMPAITVTAPRALEAEPTDSASERRVSGETLNTRPITRPGVMRHSVRRASCSVR